MFLKKYIYKIQYLNDDLQPHRDNNPSIIYSKGTKVWYKNGLLHRINGPSVIDLDKQKWYFNGKLHNPNGPAIEWRNGIKEYYLHGIEIQKEDLNKDPNYIKLKYNI